MSLVDNLGSLYNLAAVALIGAVTLTSPQAHARVLDHASGMHMGLGDLTILDSHMSTVWQVSDSFIVRGSSIDNLTVVGNAFLDGSTITTSSFIGKVNSSNYTTFKEDVALTTSLSKFSDTSIRGNLMVDHHGDERTDPQIELSNTNITGDIVCKDHCYVRSFNSSFRELKNGTLN